MVAISGAIMPAPLAIPFRVTVTPSILSVLVAIFGNVSVVMIARAGSIHGVIAARLKQVCRTPSNFEASSGSPITPVEASKTSSGAQPKACAAIFAVCCTACAPVCPVKALALPEFTTSPRAVPFLNTFRHQSTGADGHFDRVRTPAACVPASRATSKTSVRFL